MSLPAVFLDRDGTIIQDVSYLRDPADVRLVPGAAAAIRRVNDARVPVIVVTNQSGIARGILSLAEYEAVRERVDRLLDDEAGARIDASYMCPHHPDVDGRCDCRKPNTLLFWQAAAAHDLDLARSAYIGDRWRDAAPVLALGGLGIVVPADSTPAEEREWIERDRITTLRSLDDAVTYFLATLPASPIQQ